MRAVPLLVAALFSQVALADLFTAHLAYEKGDYATAAKDYRSMAELGNPTAQYDLAALYVNGQGVPQSDLNAYAWASLAASEGHALARALADKIRPQLAPGSEKIAHDMVAQYDRAALDASIMPQIGDDQTNAARCRPLSRPSTRYPVEAAQLGIDGNVFMEYTVAADGTARNPRIVYAVPNDTFNSTVREAIMGTRFEGQPGVAHCHVMYRFVVSNNGANDYPRLQAFAATTLKAANAGDVNSQFLYGLMLAGLPQLGKGIGDGLPWFVKAAQSGMPAAQYQVGKSLLFGIGCKCESTKGEVWLRRAADAGQPEAQVTLAIYALRGQLSSADTEIAQRWLELAVSSKDHDGMYYLSALLAASPDEKVRDSKRALNLLEQIKRDQGVNPSTLEIRAAAQASAGAYAEATASERKAIEQARRLRWDLAPLNKRLARYQTGQPWYGNLLVL